jgi:cob(I)alamin adenosyltransferase
MAHRLSKIYTRTGDGGTTGLGDGTRTDKDSLRMELIGCVDEINSSLGMVLAQSDSDDINRVLTEIQHDLFDMGGELSMPGHEFISKEYTNRLEDELDRLNADLPYLKEFILPGGNMAAASCHLARSICRRAERRAVTVSRDEEINPEIQTYLNRLSDLLFVIARTLARANNGKEVLWQRGKTENK